MLSPQELVDCCPIERPSRASPRGREMRTRDCSNSRAMAKAVLRRARSNSTSSHSSSNRESLPDTLPVRTSRSTSRVRSSSNWPAGSPYSNGRAGCPEPLRLLRQEHQLPARARSNDSPLSWTHNPAVGGQQGAMLRSVGSQISTRRPRALQAKGFIDQNPDVSRIQQRDNVRKPRANHLRTTGSAAFCFADCRIASLKRPSRHDGGKTTRCSGTGP